RTGHPDTELVLEANFDGPADEFLASLVEKNRGFLDAIYRHCDGYRANLQSYLQKANVGKQLFYVGCPGRETKQILQECCLARHVEERARELDQPVGRRSDIVRKVW